MMLRHENEAPWQRHRQTKKARTERLRRDESMRRIDLFDASKTSYSKSSEATDDAAIYNAITSDALVHRTRCQATLNNFGIMFPQAHEVDLGASGERGARAAYDYTVFTNVQRRDVCGDILTRRAVSLLRKLPSWCFLAMMPKWWSCPTVPTTIAKFSPNNNL